MNEDDWKADDESKVELDNRIKYPDCPEHCDMSATPIIPGLIQPPWRSMNMAETGLTTGKAMETRRNKGNKK